MAKSEFAEKYPYLSRWIEEQGWIEIGQVDGTASFIVAIDEGGVVWEGKKSYRTIDDAFRNAEEGIAAWNRENLNDD